LRTDPSLKMK